MRVAAGLDDDWLGAVLGAVTGEDDETIECVHRLLLRGESVWGRRVSEVEEAFVELTALSTGQMLAAAKLAAASTSRTTLVGGLLVEIALEGGHTGLSHSLLEMASSSDGVGLGSGGVVPRSSGGASSSGSTSGLADGRRFVY